MRQTLHAPIKSGDGLAVNLASFRCHLMAENFRPRTQETYTESVRQFAKSQAGIRRTAVFGFWGATLGSEEEKGSDQVTAAEA